MTARFLALYETPADPEAFNRHYRQIHIPLIRQLPELRRYTVGRDITALYGAPYYLITELEWDSMDELHAAFASPVGRATAADAARLQELAPVRRMIFTLDDNVRYAHASASPPGPEPTSAPAGLAWAPGTACSASIAVEPDKSDGPDEVRPYRSQGFPGGLTSQNWG